MRQAVNLCSNNGTNADTTAVQWVGGRSALVILAGTYPTTCKLQYQGPDASTWIDISASTINANGVTAYDLPQGLYRLHLTGGSVAGLYATLVSIPYT